MASYLTTPNKPLSDICQVCGSPFSKDKKNKVSLFRGTAGLHTALQEATGRSVAEDDGLHDLSSQVIEVSALTTETS